MKDLLPQLHAVLDAYLRDPTGSLNGLTWAEQQDVAPKEQVSIARRLKETLAHRKDCEHLSLAYGRFYGVQQTYAARLTVHAFWCAWNLYLDPPKKIDPDLSLTLDPLRALNKKYKTPLVAPFEQIVRLGRFEWKLSK